MSLRVWIPRSPGSAFEAALRGALDPEVELLVQEGRPEPAEYDVLVSGRPAAEDLDAAAGLRMLVIPWAGLPPTTRALLRERRGIAVHNLHHNAPATAEMAIGLLIAAARKIVPADRALRAGDWRIRYDPDEGMRLIDRTALVLGHGAIGHRIAHVLVTFDMRVMAVRRHASLGVPADAVEVYGLEELDELLPQADVLVVALPSTESTRGLLDVRRLALLPPGALLVNVARADIVDEDALYEALASGRLAAAGLDVWYRYPQSPEARGETLPAHRPFHELDNVVLSPHRAGHGAGTEAERGRQLAITLNAALRGAEVPHRVDVEEGY